MAIDIGTLLLSAVFGILWVALYVGVLFVAFGGIMLAFILGAELLRVIF